MARADYFKGQLELVGQPYKPSYTQNGDVLRDTKKRDVAWYKSMLAGMASGVFVKPAEGFVSLGAELMDAFGVTQDAAADVEQYFEELNPFDETAEARTIGKVFQTLGQFSSLGYIGVKGVNFAARKLSQRALQAKKDGKYLNLKNFGEKMENSPFWRTTGKGAIGFGIGSAFSPDSEELSLLSDKSEIDDSSKDAQRKLKNRAVFAGESAAIGAAIGATIGGIASLYKAKINIKKDPITGKPIKQVDQTVVNRVEKEIKELTAPKGKKTKEGHELSRGIIQEMRFLQKQGQTAAENLTESFKNLHHPLQRLFSTTAAKEEKQIQSLIYDALTKTGVSALKVDPTHKIIDMAKKSGMSRLETNELIRNIKSTRNVVDEELIRNLNLKLSQPVKFTKDQIKSHLKMQKELGKLRGHLKKMNKTGKDSMKIRSFNPETGRKKFTTKTKDAVINDVAGLKNKLKIVNQQHAGYVLTGNIRKMYKEAVGKFLPVMWKASLSKQFQKGPLKNLLQYKPISEERQGAIDFIKTRMGGSFLRKDAEALVDKIIRTGVVPKEYGLKLGAREVKDVTNYGKKITRYEPEIETLLGKVDDPVFNVVNTIGNLAQKRLTQESREKLFDIGKKLGYIGKVGSRSDRKGGALNETFKGRKGDLPTSLTHGYVDDAGKRQQWRMTKEFKENFLEPTKTADPSQMNWLGGAYSYLMLLPKYLSQSLKTTASGITHVRNFISAGAFAMANGNLTFLKNPITQPGRYVKAFNEAFWTRGKGKGAGFWKDEYDKYLRLGVVNTNVRLGDIRGLMDDLSNLSAIRGGSEINNTLFGRLIRPFTSSVKGTWKWAERQYQAEDDFWKIINFHGEKDKLASWNKFNKGRAKMSESDIEEIAAKLVRDQVPNYDMVPELVKQLRKAPIGNFVSFPAEMVRTTGNIYQRAIWEITNGKKLNNPELTKIGYQRLAGLTFTAAGLPVGVQTAAKVAYNVSEEEMMSLKRFVPEWSQNSVLVPIRDKKTGDLKYMDLSYSLAYDVVARPGMTLINALAEGTEDEESLIEMLGQAYYQSTKEFVEPFVDESIYTKALADVSPIFGRGGRTQEGKPVWNEGDPFGEKVAKAFTHVVAKPFEIGSLQQFKRLKYHSGEEGVPDTYGRKYERKDELPGLAGFRVVDPHPEKGLIYKVSAFNKKLNASQKAWFSDVNRGGIQTSDDIYKQWAGAQRSRFDAMREMYKDAQAALTLNANYSAFNNEMDRVSDKKTRNGVIWGYFKPYEPSDKTIEVLQKRAIQDGWVSDLQKGINRIKVKSAQTDSIPLLGTNPFDWWEEDELEEIPPLNTLLNNNKIKKELEPVVMGDTIEDMPTARRVEPTSPPIRTAEAGTRKRGPLGMPLPKTPTQQKRLATMERGQQIFGVTDPIFSKDGGEVKKYAKGGEVKNSNYSIINELDLVTQNFDTGGTVNPFGHQPTTQKEPVYKTDPIMVYGDRIEEPKVEPKIEQEPVIAKTEEPIIEKKEEPITKEEKTITDSVKQTFVPTPVKLILTQFNPLKGDKPDTFNAEHVGKNVVDTATLVANVAESKGRKWVHYEDYGVTKRGLSLAALVGEKYSPKTNPKYITENNPKGKVPYTKEKLKEMTDHVAEIYPLNPIGAARFVHDLKTDPKIETALAIGGFSILYDKKGNRSVKDQFNFNNVNEGAKDFYRLMRSAFSKSKHIALHEGEGPWSIFPLGPRKEKEAEIAAK